MSEKSFIEVRARLSEEEYFELLGLQRYLYEKKRIFAPTISKLVKFIILDYIRMSKNEQIKSEQQQDTQQQDTQQRDVQQQSDAQNIW